MIAGVGTDLVEIKRIIRALERNDRFLSRVFSEDEQAYFALKRQNAASIAANFAGKEAVLKVLGTGIRGMQWRDIEILRDGLGKPYVRLTGGAAAIARDKGIDEIEISLSHTREHALAFAIGKQRERRSDAQTGGEHGKTDLD